MGVPGCDLVIGSLEFAAFGVEVVLSPGAAHGKFRVDECHVTLDLEIAIVRKVVQGVGGDQLVTAARGNVAPEQPFPAQVDEPLIGLEAHGPGGLCRCRRQ